MPYQAAGRVTWAPSTSRPILAKGLTTGANLLTPVTPPFLQCPHLNGGAAVDLRSLPGLRRPDFRSDRSKAVSVLYVEAPHALTRRSVVVARICRPLTPGPLLSP